VKKMKKKKYLGETKLDSYENTPYEGWTQQDWAIEYIARYGGIDGDHHKTWVLDQVVRILKGTPVGLRLAKWDDGQQEYRFSTEESSAEYKEFVEEIKEWNEETEEYDYEWDEGIAP
jgi:hypothetical protein